MDQDGGDMTRSLFAFTAYCPQCNSLAPDTYKRGSPFICQDCGESVNTIVDGVDLQHHRALLDWATAEAGRTWGFRRRYGRWDQDYMLTLLQGTDYAYTRSVGVYIVNHEIITAIREWQKNYDRDNEGDVLYEFTID